MSRNRLPGPQPARGTSTPTLASPTAKPLPSADLAYFESRFGQDFANVRVHAGTEAGAIADAMGAKAVTSGEDIAFAPGRYSPGTAAGRELLAHELAHVAQQRQGGSTGHAAVESAAHGAARTVASGGSVPAQSLGGAADGGLYCDDDESKAAPAGPLPGPLVPYANGVGPPMPPPWLLPPLQPDPKIDWLSMRKPFETRGVPFTMREADDITAEWGRSKALLETFGIDERFKFLFMDQDWLLNAGLGFQLDTLNARDHPNAIDRINRDWDATKSAQGEWKIPNINFFTQKF